MNGVVGLGAWGGAALLPFDVAPEESPSSSLDCKSFRTSWGLCICRCICRCIANRPFLQIWAVDERLDWYCWSTGQQPLSPVSHMAWQATIL